MTEDDKALVERLREVNSLIAIKVASDAADRIEALEAENERLREALRMLDEAYCNDDYSTLEGKAKGRAARSYRDWETDRKSVV